MNKTFKLIIVSLTLSLLLLSCVTTNKGTNKTITGSASVDLTNAEIYDISPKVVLPGTLISIFGNGFGDEAGIITIGGVDIDNFLGWEDDIIWFTAPEGIEPESEVQVGYEIAEAYINPAPEGSITVEWVIDATATQDMVNIRYTQFKLDSPPTLTKPLHIKGQWAKGSEAYGLLDQGWDGGSRQRMFNIPGTETWVTQAVFTPEAINSFGKNMMSFAVEDGDDVARNLSSFESDFAFIVKKKWASAVGLSSDPAVKIDDKNKMFNPETRKITLNYPLQ